MPHRREMTEVRALPGVLLTILAAGCAIGPTYRRPPVDVPPAWRAPSAADDSLRPFFDSLRAAGDSASRAAPDTAVRPVMSDTTPRALLLPDSAVGLGWFTLFRDTVLQRLVVTAVRENRDVRTAVASIDEFRAQYGIARGALLPLVTGNAQAGTNKIVFAGGAPVSFDVWKATADLSWELDFWGRLRRGTEAARADFLAREESERAVVLSLVSDVATAYLELRELDQDLAIARRTMESRQETLRLARRRFQQGLISELDVRQFEAQVADPAARVADFDRQVAQKENQLSILLGHHPEAVPRGRPLADVLSTIEVPAALPSTLLERRPDVRQAEDQLHAATARIGATEAAIFPRFTISGEIGTQGSKASQLFGANSQIHQFFAGISFPLFAGGQLTNAVKVARARAEQARAQYEQAVLVALQETQDALVALRASRDQLAAQHLQVTALRQALALATKRYENGISSYLDVLDVQRSLFTAELSAAQAQRQELVAAVQLYKALGGGWTDESAPRPR